MRPRRKTPIADLGPVFSLFLMIVCLNFMIFKYINNIIFTIMSTIQKKEKGLQKYSFRGYTPEQLNELTQEQVVELFRARMRRRFARSIL